MTEKRKPGRGLADISHYFITESKPPQAPQPAQAQAQEAVAAAPPAAPPRHLVLLGSRSPEARALVAANLACAWSADGAAVEVVDGEKRIPNAHFLMGGLFPQNAALQPNGHPLVLRLDASRAIFLSSWDGEKSGPAAAPKSVIWNGPLAATLAVLPRLETPPRLLVVLEPDRRKLMEAYLDLRQAATLRPDAEIGAVVYARQAGRAAENVFAFFSGLCRRQWNVEVKGGGTLAWEPSLARSILARMPAVLDPEESRAKEALQLLAQNWRD